MHDFIYKKHQLFFARTTVNRNRKKRISHFNRNIFYIRLHWAGNLSLDNRNTDNSLKFGF